MEPTDILRLFHRIGQSLKQCHDNSNGRASMAQAVVKSLGEAVSVDRVLLLLSGGHEQHQPERVIFDLAAEYMESQQPDALGQKRYHLSKSSEAYRLLLSGKPLPLKDLIAEPADPVGGAESDQTVPFAQFLSDVKSKSLLAFPIVHDQMLLGCLALCNAGEQSVFSEETLEIGELVADELCLALASMQATASGALDMRAFTDSHIASLIVDGVSGRIKRANLAACQMFASAQDDLIGQSLTKLMPEGQKLSLSLRELDDKTPTVSVSTLFYPSTGGQARHLDACLSLLSKQTREDVLVILTPIPKDLEAVKPARSSPLKGEDRSAAELASNLSKELTWERWVRQIICKLHASLDRDTLLQTVVDGFGRALGASRCLIVRTDGPASPMVTHEYAEADTSPLGLGRTGQFPSVIVSYFRHRVAAIPDLSALERSGELSALEYEYFADNGIKGIAGAPISSHGFHYGVIIILESGTTRKWSPHELDMLEIAATQTAVALGHCQAYLQLKDQLFNMNLLGNLTQQLTNTLEMVSRANKPEAEDRSHGAATIHSGSAPPLSLRELEVLKLIASGLANREIAQRLFLTESTVELHASRIRKKLKLKSRTALVKYACDNGLA